MKCGIHPKRSLVGVVFTDGSRSWMKVVPGRRFVKVKAKVTPAGIASSLAPEVGGEKATSWCCLEKDPKNHVAWGVVGGLVV
jgi:hypothetical protein